MIAWRRWWAMPVLLFAGIVGPGLDVSAIARLPIPAGVIVSFAYAAAWTVLIVAAVITALWSADRLLSLRYGRRRPRDATTSASRVYGLLALVVLGGVLAAAVGVLA